MVFVCGDEKDRYCDEDDHKHNKSTKATLSVQSRPKLMRFQSSPARFLSHKKQPSVSDDNDDNDDDDLGRI